jgi:probable HAF family extracellular repeat protein
MNPTNWNCYLALAFLVLTSAVSWPSKCAAASYSIIDLGVLEGTVSSSAYGLNASGQAVGGSATADGNGRAFLYDGTMHDLGTFGGTWSVGYGINGAGRAVGVAATAEGNGRAFLYDGTMHDLGTLGGTSSEARGINATGQVVGSTGLFGDAESHAFLYDGTMYDLGTFGGSYSEALGINAAGHVTGSACFVGNDVRHAYFYDGTMHDLGTLGGPESVGYGINDAGQVVGASTMDEGNIDPHAFLYDGTLHDLGTLGGAFSYAYCINTAGKVVGYSLTTDNIAEHAFVYDGVHGMVDLNSLIDPLSGWELNTAFGINDLGQICGDGFINGDLHAFLMTPVPEPSTFVLVACSPKPDPCVMRVSSVPVGKENLDEAEATRSGADHQEAA